MAKERHDQHDPGSSRNTLLVLTIGALLVAGLVVWALTRTVERPPTALNQTPAGADLPAVSPTDTGTPVASATAPIRTSLPTEHGQEPEKAAVPRVSAEDLKERFEKGEVTIVDVRDSGSYAAGHIRGAMHIPFASVQSQIDLLPKGKDVVTYCT